MPSNLLGGISKQKDEKMNLQQNTPARVSVSNTFERTLTEEQRFLQGVMNGEIRLIPHEDVVRKLENVLKNGLSRK